MQTIAIIGGNGYIGKHLAYFLQDKGMHPMLFDLQEETSLPGFDYKICDITSKSFWESFQPEEFCAIYFFAGLSGPEASFLKAESYIDINEKGLLLVLQRLMSLGKKAPKIIFPSSRLVYRGGATVNEESVLEPRSVYAANKIACEGLLSAYYHRYGIRYAVLRICVPFGNYLDRKYSYGTLGFFVKNVMEGKPITVYGNGETIKTYTHIWDICEIFHRLEKQDDAIGIFNAGGHDYSLKNVAEMVASRFHGVVDYIPWPENASKIEMGNISLDATKLARLIGFNQYRRMEEFINDL